MRRFMYLLRCPAGRFVNTGRGRVERRRWDLGLRRCDRVAVERKFNADWSAAKMSNLRSWVTLLAKGSPYSITERRVPELIPVLGSQPAGGVSHKPDNRLPLLPARPAVTLATFKRVASNFAAWWTEARWVWTVCLGLLPDSVATAIWTRALLRLSPAR